MRITRRALLAAPGLAIVTPAVAESLRVEATGDGGFRVLGADPNWEQTGAQLRAALGEGARADVEPDAQQVLISGMLAGETLRLHLRFARSGGALTVATRGRLGKVPPFEGRPRLLPVLLDERVAAGALARGLGFDPGSPTYLTLDAALGCHIVCGSGFALGHKLHANGRLRLLPDAGDDACLAVLEPPKMNGCRLLGKRGAVPFVLEPRPDRLLVVAGEGGARRLRLKGGGSLVVAGARLSYGSGSTVEFTTAGHATGSWRLDLLLSPGVQRVDTPEGRVELSASGRSDIVAEGGFGCVRTASARAVLRHVALRLPLQAGGRCYADIGRLDFADNTPVTLAVTATDGVDPAASRIPLAPNAGAMRLRLDTGDLWAGRDADMFRARFCFRGLDLVVRRRAPVLRRRSDSRDEPTLIVRLPPQHVMEQAFPRVAPVLPGRALKPEELASAFNREGRSKLGEALSKEAPEFARFSEKFVERYNSLVKRQRKVEEGRQPPRAPYPSSETVALERIYIGPDGLITPLGHRAARETAYSLAPLPKLVDMRLGLSEILVSDVLRRNGRLDPNRTDPKAAPDAARALGELLEEAAKRQADMARVLAAWRASNPSGPILLAEWRQNWPDALRPGEARDGLKATLSAVPLAQPKPDVEQALQDGYRSVSPSKLPVETRTAGETRLAFTLCVKPGCTLPWALSTLLDWGTMELRVSRRAEMRVEPVAAEAQPSIELQHLLARQLGLDESKVMSERLERLRSMLRTGPDETETAIELPARLILSPDREHSLAPANGKPAGQGRPRPRFRTSAHPHARAGRVPVWRADLQEDPGEPYSLRAIHTPDYEHDDVDGKQLSDPFRHTYYRGRQAGKAGGPVFALDDFDRRQIVALSSLHGLPVLARRGAGGVLQTSQVSPPDSFRIDDKLVQEQDREEQGLYMPRALPTRLLRLSPLGGTLDLNAPFVPPAPLRAKQNDKAEIYENTFDAYSLERVRIFITLGREVTTEVVYKGFLYPLGFRAALLKVTERQYLPWPATYDPDVERWSGPLAFQVQRYFIQVSNPEKTFPGIAQPFRGRGWPARSLTMLTQRTPDLFDPTRAMDEREEGATWRELSDGRLDHAQRSGLVFWPRTAAGAAGNVRFRFTVDGRPEPVSMPLIFIDNQAAHDAPTMRALQAYWNDPAARSEQPDTNDTRAWQALRRIEHAGVPRRYAEEDASGDTTFETQSWEVRVDSRKEVLLPHGPDNPLPAGEQSPTAWQMNAAMESADEPPFYPRCLEARVHHDAVARFTGNPHSGIAVRFLEDYLESGLPVLTGEERKDKTINEIEALQATILAAERAAAKNNTDGRPTPSDPRREVFLRIVGDIPRQTMGRNGERSAGVVRPEMDYLFIGRKGPVGGKPPEHPGEAPREVPNKVKPDFVLPDARLCGLVSLQSILAFAKDSAAPLLRQTVEYGLGEAVGQADELTKTLGGSLLSVLKPVMDRFKEGGETGESLRNAYRGAYSAMGRLEKALNDMAGQNDAAGKGIAGLPEVATAGRELRAELDRLAANPLGPLTELGQKKLSEVRDEIEREARKRLNAAIPKIEIDRAQLKQLRDAFAPLGEALLALDAALDQLLPLPKPDEAKALRDHADRAFREATRRTFTVSSDKLPPSLAELRREWRHQVRAALDADSAPGVSSERLTQLYDAIEASLAKFDGLPTPVVLDRFYLALRALVNADWQGALRALEQEGVRRLRAWTGSQLDSACSAAGTKVAIAAKHLREALLASAVPKPCVPAVCRGDTPPAPAAEICARLWALCATPELRGPAEEVGKTLAWVDAVVSGFGQGDPCKPSPEAGAARLMDELRRLDAARCAFVAALETLLLALAGVASKTMKDAAAQEAAVLAAALLSMLRPKDPAFTKLQTALEPALGNQGAASIVEVLRESGQAVAAVQDALEKVKDVAGLGQALDQLGPATEPTRALRALLVAGRTAVQDMLLAAALPAVQVADDAAKTLLGAMAAFLDEAQTLRQKALPTLRPLDQSLGLRGDERLTGLLFLNLLPPVPDEPSDPVTGKDDLDRERDRIAAALAGDANVRADELVTTVPAWFLSGGAGSSVEQILRALGDRLLVSARQKLLRVLNVDALRNKLETELEKLVPARRRLDYAWTVPGPAGEQDLGGIVTFRGGDFSVRAEAVLDLLKPTAPVTGRVGGTIGDFDIGIRGAGAKWLTLFFSGIRFEQELGGPAHVEEPKLKSFRPEGNLLFLAGLAAYCNLKDGDAGDKAPAGGTPLPNGIYTVPRPGGGAGLRAGYGLSFGALQIGTMAVLDVVFDAHIELPFDGDRGHAELSLSTPDKPATLVCAPYGGTAYAKMRSVPRIGRADLATEFDVSFQFGAAVAISFGILQGSGRVMTGLRVFDSDNGPGFSALFVAAFEGHIACFGIAASFVLALSYKPGTGGNRLTGTAALTYSFSIGPVKKSFTVHVERDAGNGLKTGMNLLPLDTDQPRVMLANASPGAPHSTAPRARLRSDVPGMMQDWPRYSARFANPRDVLGRRRRA
ncbi:hypothetical protein [Methylobacterium sp. J-067]|uniref:hypothetical protein n=1 Tax=Methylobacterium sp. J-067 TaxID=2836648 RepID=UPI001FBAEBBB|nr:hypothetical protein [Methylobacterium sp. J-067]MCJ2023158.1 hypothetical protein [Methylobacterium sp. J-067]